MKTAGTRFDAIPRVLHQTWKTTEIPAVWRPHHASWRRHLPDWEHRLWTDAECRQLVVDRYPWFLPTFDAFPRAIQRVDASKYLIVHTHGGVYADLDCECLRPIDPIVARGGVVVGRTRDGVIECATFASSPGHVFWERVLRAIERPPLTARLVRGMPGLDSSHVLLSTGTQMLRRAVKRYVREAARTPDAPGITICPPDFFSSRSWLDRHEPFADDGKAYVHHHYTDSWLQPDDIRLLQYFTRRHLRRAGSVLALTAVAGIIAWAIGSGSGR